jgi:cob(I)alamin adenosyltransferase
MPRWHGRGDPRQWEPAMHETGSGTVQLYTGNGKGKTTASLGAALRAAGHGKRVLVIQFMKGRLYGEIEAVKMLGGLITIEQYGRDEFVDPKNPDPIDTELAGKGWARARGAAQDEELDLLILDEINVAVSFGLIELDEVIDFIRNRPPRLELILTGRYAPDRLIEIADTVTEMQEIKHHYGKGIKARKGIEY